ncbi:pathogen-related protein-like [Momordica charantia]|uniref:Pathogen-related protein-like n=1 Tax=Momordica charantia TaxID=3673 RepID=A0A6J1CQZ3_MOMCH|nr:pathogen-related protein-like [Momordica charantia]
MASSGAKEDPYRWLLNGDVEKNTTWKFGAPPNYEAVNNLFEQGRTKIWPPGSLEEEVQNLVKNWEVENINKVVPEDFKIMDPKKVTFSLNGRKPITLEEKRKLGGGYNASLQTSLPAKYRLYNLEEETAETSNKLFTTTFPRGFALEVVRVYAGPPVIVYKFRHWAFMEGPYKGHAPTGEMVELYGIGIFELDENKKIVKVEMFYDPAELLGPLVKGPILDDSVEKGKEISGCPILKNLG